MVVGAYYLHENGSLIYKPAVVFAGNLEYFDSKFVKHVWLLLTTPPASTRKGQIKWFLNDLLKVAYREGAKESEVLKWIKFFCETKEYSPILKKYTPEEITQHIVQSTLTKFLKGIKDGKK